jgi:SAM-dependent methyltransferase
MIEDESAQPVVAFYAAILKSRGIRLVPDSMILDYGCGSGRHTYEYLEAGFRNAFGYDVRDYVALRSPADRDRFRFDPRPGDVGGYPTMSSVPWPADTFDFVFATSVFEHVMDQELAYAEIHRVLKPGGVFLNSFPSKWRPIEAHLNIPFGGVFTWRPYLKLCAHLGIRGANQETYTANQLVELNHLFVTHGVNYLSGRQVAELLRRTFGEFEFEYVEDAYIPHSPGRSRHLAAALKFVPMLRQAFRFAHTRAILARKANIAKQRDRREVGAIK